jgi:hypothetical protein
MQTQPEPKPNASKVASPLRIGVMLDSLRSSAWVAKILADIQASDFAEIVLVVMNDAPRTAPKRSFRERLRMYWIYGLYNRYVAWDQRAQCGKHDAFAAIALEQILGNAEIIKTKPLQKGFVDRFSDEDVDRIKQARLDVLFRFGFRIIRGGILSTARYGVWSFHHGDNREYRGAPPGFWEMYERNAVTGSLLQILTEDLDGGHVIYRSLAATNFDSLYLNRNATYWKTAEFPLRRLRQLYRYGWEFIQALPEYNEADEYKKGIYKTPRAPVMARFLSRWTSTWLKRKLRARVLSQRTQWFVALRRREGARTVATDMTGFRILPIPPGHFHADPFLFRRNGKTYLFFEDFDFRAGKADISCMEVDDSGNCGPAESVLVRDYHLSYPFVFEWRGEVYMLPETRASGRVELYRAEAFPGRWVLERVLMDQVAAVDPTLFQHNGRLWLFLNMAAPGAETTDELHLFYADSPLGDWTPHRCNPVVSDVRRARPGGALFMENGELIRPSQDCSLRYGYALVLNRVEKLSETEYRETPIHHIGPEWQEGNLCTHTYNRTDGWEVVDGMFLPRRLRFLPGRRW